MSDSHWSTDVLAFVQDEFSRRLAAPNVAPSPAAAAKIESAIIDQLQKLLSNVVDVSCNTGGGGGSSSGGGGAGSVSWWSALPELHQLHCSQWRDGQLVRYRCMIRDMFDPELYQRAYVVRPPVMANATTTNGGATGASRIVSGLFRDLAPANGADQGPAEEPLSSPLLSLLGQRQPLLCCTVPWLTDWACQMLCGTSTSTSAATASTSTDTDTAMNGTATATATTDTVTDGIANSNSQPQLHVTGGGGSVGGALKRPIAESDSAMDTGESDGGVLTAAEANGLDVKRHMTEMTAAAMSSGATAAAGGATAAAGGSVDGAGDNALLCLVKVYDDAHGLLVNQMVEFVGVLSVHPALNGANLVTGAAARRCNGVAPPDAAGGGGGGGDDDDAETLAHNPPASRVPRLHALAWRQLRQCSQVPQSHMSQLLLPPPASPSSCSVSPSAAAAPSMAAAIREQLLQLLTTALLGDQLAAELLLCHLVSSVYTRRDQLPLGQLSLNISNITAVVSPPPAPSASSSTGAVFVQLLQQLLQQLVERLCVFVASRQRLNTAVLVPRKDYATNTLSSALLQLTDSTHLLIDETALTEGELDERGVANVAALRAMLRDQVVRYDFGFNQLPFHTDIVTLVLSTGPSLLPCDIKLALQPATPVSASTTGGGVEHLRAIFAALHEYLTPDLVQKIRSYLLVVRQMEYTIPEPVQCVVQADFVNWRQSAAAGGGGSGGSWWRPDGELLHQALVVARLQTLSRGERALTEPLWRRSVELLRQLHSRQLATRGGPGGGTAAA